MKKILLAGVFFAILGVIGMAFSTFVLHESYGSEGKYSENRVVEKNIKELEVRGGNQFVTFKQSTDDKIHIAIKHVKNKDSVKIEETDGKLFIDADADHKKFHFDYGINRNGRVEIKLPKKTLEKIKIDVSTGTIEADILKAEEVDAKVEAGEIDVQAIDAVHFIGKVNTGELAVKNLGVDNVDFEVNVGEITIGQLPEDINIKGKVDTGSATLKYHEHPINTNFDVNTTVGDTNIDKEVSERNLNGTGENLVEIQVDVGNVTIEME